MSRRENIEEWFMRYSDDIYKFLVYYTGQRDVEDLVQDVFIKAIKSYDNFQGRSQPKTWLLTIARNTAIDHSRKKRLLNWLPDNWLLHVRETGPTPEEIIGENEEKRLVYQAVSQLKPAYREVIILRSIKGLSLTETASILGWSESKVSTTMHRAIKALQQKCNEKKETKGMMNHVI
ncbi:RNA polymerase sigma factor [Brevibacillus daliensis]|uniref:RNA polymerase sigma factor n=1 Tax=Brevibacillus daliensis TaxID=2892995 RepID=UPI001E59539F|nr:RNA polymerase sigma factor [Brevibacillus daliensis]